MNKKIITEALEVHETLNPKIWNKDMTLKPDVREKILEIVEEFKETIKGMTEIELNPIDIYLLGSNASYNYTEHSDMDVHIVVNFEMIDDNTGLVQTLMNFSKADFNSSYDISIKGIDVELYVEDVNASTLSNGIFSVLNNEWIKKPEPITDVPEIDIEDDIDEWKDKINQVLNHGAPMQINQTIDELYLLRKNGLLTDGEYGRGNQIFKEIRNLSLLKDLKDKYLEMKSKELSLENKRRRTMSKYTESNGNNIDWRYLEDVEEGMINNLPEEDIDFWVRADDNVCKLLKSSRSEVIFTNGEGTYSDFSLDSGEWNKEREVKKYYLTLYSDSEGNKVVTDMAKNYYFANEDDFNKITDMYVDRYETEALNLKTTDEVSIVKRGDWELIKDSTFGDTDEYLILKNDEVVMSIRANSDDEATKRFWKYVQRGW